MKTLVSILTGRKDHPIFDTNNNDAVFDYLVKENPEGKVWRDKDIKTDIVVKDEIGLDVFNIIDVELIKL